MIVALLASLGLTDVPHGTTTPDVRPEAPTRIVFMGDSLTDVEGMDTPFPMYPELLVSNDARWWPGAEGQDLVSAYPSLAVVHNVAVGGSVSSALRWQLRELEAREGAGPQRGETLVVISTGGNDVLESMDPFAIPEITRGITANLRRVKGALEARYPDGMHLYVANIPDPTGAGDAGEPRCWEPEQAVYLDEMVNAINGRMRAAGESEGYGVVDYYGLVRDHGYGGLGVDAADPLAADPVHWYMDCVHPNARGNDALRHLFLEAIVGG